jgi:N-acetylmuramoyl-L-alanine amidase
VEDETPDISVDDTTKINPVKVTVSANGVNLRKGPGTNYPTCGVVYKGKTLTITETKDATGYTWGKFEGGWIALCFTNYDAVKGQGQEEKPTTQPTEPEQQPDKEDPKKGTMGTVTGNEVRVRSGAGTNYKVLRYHNKGDRVEVFETKKVGNINWGKLKDGWIAMSYVKLDEKAPEKEPEASKPAEPEAPKPTEPEKDETKVLMTGTVNVNDKLRVRKGPGTSYAVVGSLAAKTRVNIYETKQVGSTTWGRVDEGWISLYYVILDKTETTKPEQSTTIKGTITADCLRVRSGAGTNYKVVGYLYQGAKVEILETKQVGTATWGRIKTGWISMTYVKQ